MKTEKSLLRRIFSLKGIAIGITSVCCSCLAVLAIVWLYEDRRAKSDWEKYKADLESQGEHLDAPYFAPPPVPDEKNFALTPLIKPLFDEKAEPSPLLKISTKAKTPRAPFPAAVSWTTGHATDLQPYQAYYRASAPEMHLSGSPGEDVVAFLNQYDATFKQLRDDLATHPQCRYPVRYDLVMGAQLPHLTPLRETIKALALRASAELQLGRTDDAFADITLCSQLERTFDGGPTLIDGLMRITVRHLTMQPLWEGLAAHRWSDAQLQELGKDLQAWDFLADYNRAMRWERGCANWSCEWARNDPDALYDIVDSSRSKKRASAAIICRLMRGSYYRNQIFINQAFQEGFLAILDDKKQLVDPAQSDAAAKAVTTGRWTPYVLIARIMLPVFMSVDMKFAQSQNHANMAAVACAIERHRLANGAIPATLEDLHMPALPHDIIGGRDLHYIPASGGSDYLLYSVGWNGTDGGGSVAIREDTPNSIDPRNGDWVWSLKPLTPPTP